MPMSISALRRWWERFRSHAAKYPGCEFCDQRVFRLNSGEPLRCDLVSNREWDLYENPVPPWHVMHHRTRAMFGLPCDANCTPPKPPEARRSGGLISSLKAMYFVEDVAAELTELRERGANRLRGRCPFHAGGTERTPSFDVMPDEQRFYCFGCNRHGDVVDLIEYAEEMGLPWHQARKR